MKKKILLVVGAGASIEVGYPSVKKLTDYIDEKINSSNYLSNNQKLLYKKIKYILNNGNYSIHKLLKRERIIEKIEQIERHFKNSILENPKIRDEFMKLKGMYLWEAIEPNNSLEEVFRELRNKIEIPEIKDKFIFHSQNFVNFEEILYICNELYSMSIGIDNLHNPMKEFTPIKKEFQHFTYTDYSLLFCEIIKLIKEKISRDTKSMKKDKYEKIEKFYHKLNEKFNLNIITTNYDPLLLKIFPDFFIGFDKKTKEFCQQEIILDNHKNCLYHIHGSLYNRLEKNEIIYDEEDYLNNNVTISNNSIRDTNKVILESSIIAGYDKQNKILYNPFKTYFSQIPKMIYEADGILFIGYGFNDIHLNSNFEMIRKQKIKRKIVIIDKYKEIFNEYDKVEHSNVHLKYCKSFGFHYGDCDKKSLEKNLIEIFENDKEYTAIFKMGLFKSLDFLEKIIEIFEKE